MRSRQLGNVEVFIDWDNFFHPLSEEEVGDKLARVVEIAQGYGQIDEQRAYANFRQEPTWVESLLWANGVKMAHTPALNGSGKNSDDMMMAIDIARLPFLKPSITTIVLVSGDGHFVPAIVTFKEGSMGRNAIALFTGKINATLREVVDNYFPLTDFPEEERDYSAQSESEHIEIKEKAMQLQHAKGWSVSKMRNGGNTRQEGKP